MPSGCAGPGPGVGLIDNRNGVRYSAGTGSDPGSHRTLTMDHTAQALMALALLRSLPNWERISEIYGDIDGHLSDLVGDLENHPWEGLERD
jgi:hypothetical protein